MYQKQMYDITEVCKMLGTTSRTLRFYEEKGIIQSTTVGTSSRRQYTEEQISHIKNVLVLRTLGLSVKAVAELLHKDEDYNDAVTKINASIRRFPTNIIASIFGIESREYFEINENATQNIDINNLFELSY